MRQLKQIKDFSINIKFCLIYFVFLFSVLSLFSSGTIESQDGWLYLTVARNIYYKHSIEAAPNEFKEGKNVTLNSEKKGDGKWYIPDGYGYGYSFSFLPSVALSDIFHKYYHTTPPDHFPLESDWTVLFFASFTNIFYASLLGVVMFIYGKRLGFSKKLSILLSLTTVFATNLFPLAKHAFPHMMFTTSMMLSFLCIKIYTQTKKLSYFALAIAAYIGVYASYNLSFLFPVFPLVVYFILLQKYRIFSKRNILILGVVSAMLLFIIDRIYNGLFIFIHDKLKIRLLFEGVWGFLFSPGKSIFLYSPILVFPLIFWQDIKKKIAPELVTTILLSAIYIGFYATSIVTDGHEGWHYIWHGGMAWGPRYVAPLLPFMTIISIFVLNEVRLFWKRIIFCVLFCISIGVQLLGVSLPYLVQYRGLPQSIEVNEEELTRYDYASFVPRFSPLLSMRREFIVKLKNLIKTLDHGKYDVRFFDGFTFPVETPLGVFRGIKEEGHISFVQKEIAQVKTIDVTLYHAPDSTRSSQVVVQITLDDKSLETKIVLNPREEINEVVTLPTGISNGTHVFSMYIKPTTVSSFPQQVIYIKQLRINGEYVNLLSLDYPDVSPVNKKTSPISYRYYGDKNNDPWMLWYMRSGLVEWTFDFWWIKNLYIWDWPKAFFWTVLLIDCSVILFSTTALTSYLRVKAKNTRTSRKKVF